MALKQLPIGVENFIEADNSFYVDKTLIIGDIINYFIGHSLLFTRPRRFGKSLMVSMIEYFFTNKGDYSSHFKNKKILMDNKYLEYLNKYPVIHLNMKNLAHNNKNTMLSECVELISSIYRKFPEVADNDSLFDYEKERYYRIANKEINNPMEYCDSINFLSELLYKKYNKKVIILIDEYDTPLENAYQNGFYDGVINFFKGFYSSSLKGNDNLFFSITTGVLQISKESIFSELNNLDVYSVIDDDFVQYFGFTEEEVKEMLDLFQVDIDINILKEWYGGYGNKRTEIYNPWSILNFIQKNILDYYWVNTSSNTTISNLIRSTPNGIEKLNEFVNNEISSVNINTSISYKDIRYDEKTLFSLLVQSGYLVAHRMGYDRKFILSIPNNEIRQVFMNEVISRNEYQGNTILLNNLKSSILKGSEDDISYLLDEFILSCFSYYDLTNEKEYQILTITLLRLLFDEYIVKSEVNTNKGRCDVLLIPKRKEYPGIVVELKKYKGKLSEARLNEFALSAINQAKDNNYYNDIKKIGASKCLIYGFVFDNKSHAIKVETINFKE